MTDKEIIKALECCLDAECYKCPLLKDSECRTNSVSAILDLINRYEAEIERLTVNMNAFGLGMIREKERADTAKAEAIKEFAERLKEKGAYNSFNELIIFEDMVDNLVKEMTGETKTAETDFPKDYSYGY